MDSKNIELHTHIPQDFLDDVLRHVSTVIYVAIVSISIDVSVSVSTWVVNCDVFNVGDTSSYVLIPAWEARNVCLLRVSADYRFSQ